MNPITYNLQKFNENYNELKIAGGGVQVYPHIV